MFEHFAQQAKIRDSKILNGADVWRLYDTFGFPVDLTRVMAEESGLHVNEKEFEEAQQKSKEASKAVKKSGGEELLTMDVHDLGRLDKMNDVPKTNDEYKHGKGYPSSFTLVIF